MEYHGSGAKFEGMSETMDKCVRVQRARPGGGAHTQRAAPASVQGTAQALARNTPPPRTRPAPSRAPRTHAPRVAHAPRRYRAWAIDPNVKRAAPPPMRPSLPFDGTTTNREMFKGWQLPPRRPALGVQVRALPGCTERVLLPH